jgi:N-acetyl-alpha-D-glucosaminyl L-malate synthase BshA
MKGERRMLKIGITCYPSLGGSGVIATELGKLLAERGHQVHFITHGMPFRLGKFHKNIFYHEVEVNDYFVFKYPPYNLALASKLAQIATLQQLDLLHVHYAFPHAVSAYLAKKITAHERLKIVTTLHGTDITVLAQDPTLIDIIRFAINESDLVTAVSESLINDTRRSLNITRDIELATNFVDERIYYPRNVSALRAEFAEPDEKIVLHISNFRPVKRVSDVVDIFALVRQKQKAKLLFVGEGPELPKVMAKVRALGLTESVRFLGRQDEVAEVISLADLLLLPSEKESFGLVALEAMACGVPTVGAHTGGIPELIEHGVNGFVAPIGEISTMAQYAVRMLTEDGLHASMRENGLARVRERFSGSIAAAHYESLYEKALRGGGSLDG